MKTYTLYWKNEDTNRVSSKDFTSEPGVDHSAMDAALELAQEADTNMWPWILEEDGCTVASSEVSGVWRDLYMFRDEACPDIDLELANWWSCTHPAARFMTQFFASRAVGADRHHILDDTYVVRKADGSSETTEIESKAQLLELLETVFGLAPKETDGIDRYLPAQASI